MIIHIKNMIIHIKNSIYILFISYYLKTKKEVNDQTS